MPAHHESTIMLLVKSLTIWFSTWVGKTLIFSNTALTGPWEALLNRAPELAVVVFLVVVFLKHIASEKEKDREERKADRETMRQIGEACQRSIDKNTEAHEKLIASNTRFMDRIQPQA